MKTHEEFLKEVDEELKIENQTKQALSEDVIGRRDDG